MWFQVPKRFEGHEFQREELHYYLGWARRACFLTALLAVFNLIIATGLLYQSGDIWCHSGHGRVPNVFNVSNMTARRGTIKADVGLRDKSEGGIADTTDPSIPQFLPELDWPPETDLVIRQEIVDTNLDPAIPEFLPELDWPPEASMSKCFVLHT